MTKITKILLDMDGVKCDFMKAYDAIQMPNSYKKFRLSVMHLRIFETLEWMPNGRALTQFLDTLEIPIELLTSRGSRDDILGNEAIRQKNVWLDKHNIQYPRNFARTGLEKVKHSLPGTLLIDDTPKVVASFRTGQGKAILYEDSKFEEMKELIKAHL